MQELPAKSDRIFDNRYELIKVLGSGGIGTVYAAKQLDSGRLLALKVLHNNFAEDFKERFLREGQTLSRLSHENIVTAYHLGLSTSGIPYLAMEIIEGKTLRRILQDGPLSAKRVLSIGEQLCAALSYMHQNAIVHRDLKPDNLVLIEEANKEQLKLIDFGLACIIEDEALRQKLTGTGVVLGSLDYMSPEQCRGERASHLSDLYSASACLFEMLSGYPPYKAESPAGLMYQHLNAPVPKLKLKASALLNRQFNGLFARGLAKDPAKRFQSAGELAEALCSIQSNLENEEQNFGAAKSKGILAAVSALIVISGLSWLCFNSAMTGMKKQVKEENGRQEVLSPRSSNSAEGMRQLIKRQNLSSNYRINTALKYLEENGMQGNEDLAEDLKSLASSAHGAKSKSLQTQVSYSLGTLYFESGQWKKSLPYLKEINALDLKAPEAQGLLKLDDYYTAKGYLSRAYMLAGKAEEARKLSFEIAREPIEGDAEALLNAFELHDEKLAQEIIRTQDRSGSLTTEARICRQAGRLDLCRICLDKAPQFPMNTNMQLAHRLELGKLFLSSGNAAKAREIFAELAEDPSLPDYFADGRRGKTSYDFALMFELSGLHEKALYAAFSRPKFEEPQIMLLRAHLLVEDGKFQEARKYLRSETIIIDPETKTAQNALSRLEKLEKLEKEKAQKQATSKKPQLLLLSSLSY